ncbi:10231_t:CDS:2 [Entrophospora sp. SA101]|nr:10231_t:CDS:2 [Entrophospora sp. SA101]
MLEANFNNNNNNSNDTSNTNPTATSLHNTPVITNAASKTSLTSSASSSSSMIAVVAADKLFKHEVYEQVKELINFYQHEEIQGSDKQILKI